MPACMSCNTKAEQAEVLRAAREGPSLEPGAREVRLEILIGDMREVVVRKGRIEVPAIAREGAIENSSLRNS